MDRQNVSTISQPNQNKDQKLFILIWNKRKYTRLQCGNNVWRKGSGHLDFNMQVDMFKVPFHEGDGLTSILRFLIE